MAEDEDRRPRRFPGPLAGRALLALGSMGLCLLAAELALRFAGFSYPESAGESDRGLVNPMLWEPGNYRSKLDEARGVDIVFLGDSCTERGRYGRYLADLIAKKRPGQSLSSFNGGVTGWSSHQGLRRMKSHPTFRESEIVVIQFGWNDHWFHRGIRDKDFALIAHPAFRAIENLRLAQLIFKVYVLNAGPEASLRVPIDDFENNLRAMIAFARENGVAPVLLTSPTVIAPGREPVYLADRHARELSEVAPLHRAYMDAVREIAREEGAVLCDVAQAFERIPNAVRVREYFMRDGVHLYPAGNRKIAGILYECLERENLIAPILRPADEARQIFVRDLPVRHPPKEFRSPPGLPPRLGLYRVEYSDDGELHVQGWALSSRPVDYVVVFVEGKNVGMAHYPNYYPQALEEFPEYRDDSGGFTYVRKLNFPPDAKIEGEVRVFSGDDLLIARPFATTVAPEPAP